MMKIIGLCFVFALLIHAGILAAENHHQQIKLEDIERDNLISEQRAQQSETLETQQSQHIRPPTYNHLNIQDSHYQLDGNDITYANNELKHQSPIQHHPHHPHQQPQQHYYHHQSHLPQSPPTANHQLQHQHQPHHQQQIQYVTVNPNEQYSDNQVEYAPPSSPAYTPVHESDKTFSAPARHSLISPIIPTVSATPPTYLAQQPQYVYVQVGQQKQNKKQPQTQQQKQQNSQNSATVFPQPEDDDNDENSLYAGKNIIQQQQSADVTYATEHQQQTGGGRLTYAHQPIVKYVPYVSHGPHQQNYVMMVPLKSTEVYIKPAQYTQYAQQYPMQSHESGLNYVTKLQHVEDGIDENRVAAGHSIIAPNHLHTQAILPTQYGRHNIQSAPYNYHAVQAINADSSPYQHGPSHLQIQQSVEYTPALHETTSNVQDQVIGHHHHHHHDHHQQQQQQQQNQQLQYQQFQHHSVPHYSHYPYQQQPQQQQHQQQHQQQPQPQPQQQQLKSLQSQSLPLPQIHQHQQAQLQHHSNQQYSPQFFDSFQHGSYTPLDFFGLHNKHSSLIDSYIPSSVVYERSRLAAQRHNTQITNNHYHNHIPPQVERPHESIPLHPQHSSVSTHLDPTTYNTIAYSTQQGSSSNHLKRATKLKAI